MGLLVNLFTIAGGSALLTGKSLSEKRHAKKIDDKLEQGYIGTNETRQRYLLNLLLSDDPKQYAEFEEIWGKKFVRSDYGSLAELHKPIKEIADREDWEMIRTSGCPYGKEDPIWALYHECRMRNYGY